MKTAIIFCGGAMASSYSVGSILGLVEKFNLINPDIVIAGSGSAGTASYFVSEQYNSIENIWSNLLCNKKFISFKRFRKIIDIDYLIDEVFKKQDPLNVKKIKNSKIDYYISVTNAKTGNVEFISGKNNIFEVMRATKAMPVIYGKCVKLGRNTYCDTFLSSSGLNLKLKFAISLGAEKIIVLNPNIKSELSHKIFGIWSKFFKSRDFFKNQQKQNMINYSVPKKINIFYVYPKTPLNISILDNSSKSLKSTIELGRKDIFCDKELEIFLSSPKLI